MCKNIPNKILISFFSCVKMTISKYLPIQYPFISICHYHETPLEKEHKLIYMRCVTALFQHNDFV